MWGCQWTIIYLSTESWEDKKNDQNKKNGLTMKDAVRYRTAEPQKARQFEVTYQHITEQLWANLYWQLKLILAQCFESLDHDSFDLVQDALEFKLLFYSPKHRECAYCVLPTITKQFRKGSLYNNIVFVNIIFSWLRLFIFPATCLLKIPFAQCIVSDYLCQ